MTSSIVQCKIRTTRYSIFIVSSIMFFNSLHMCNAFTSCNQQQQQQRQRHQQQFVRSTTTIANNNKKTQQQHCHILHQQRIHKNDAIENDDDSSVSTGTSSSTTTATTSTRRRMILDRIIVPSIVLNFVSTITSTVEPAYGDDSIPGERKFLQEYDDFVKSSAGYSYRDASAPSSGTGAKLGDRVVYDWSGYTIGYFGRPFQAKGGPQGGAFDKDIDYSRTVLGSGTIIPALEQAMIGMKVGSIRQVIVPYVDTLTYPESDIEHTVVGPKPTTFSGQRALNFVLQNNRVDRTLLFNVKVIRIDTPDGRGGFRRG